MGSARRQSMDRLHAHAYLSVRWTEHGSQDSGDVRVLRRANGVAWARERVAGWTCGQHAPRLLRSELRLRGGRTVLGAIAGDLPGLSRAQERYDLLERSARAGHRH